MLTFIDITIEEYCTNQRLKAFTQGSDILPNPLVSLTFPPPDYRCNASSSSCTTYILTTNEVDLIFCNFPFSFSPIVD